MSENVRCFERSIIGNYVKYKDKKVEKLTNCQVKGIFSDSLAFAKKVLILCFTSS